MIKLKRVYESMEKDDGKKFLVERLWPRGVKKTALANAVWLKDVAPSFGSGSAMIPQSGRSSSVVIKSN
jgi:uncharacterized protein YeaO (DUF488 family)